MLEDDEFEKHLNSYIYKNNKAPAKNRSGIWHLFLKILYSLINKPTAIPESLFRAISQFAVHMLKEVDVRRGLQINATVYCSDSY